MRFRSVKKKKNTQNQTNLNGEVYHQGNTASSPGSPPDQVYVEAASGICREASSFLTPQAYGPRAGDSEQTSDTFGDPAPQRPATTSQLQVLVSSLQLHPPMEAPPQGLTQCLEHIVAQVK